MNRTRTAGSNGTNNAAATTLGSFTTIVKHHPKETGSKELQLYDPDLDFDICHWVKVMARPWVMDKNCLKYYPYSTWLQEVWNGHIFWLFIHRDN